MNMTGVNAQHMGIEAELKARPTKWLELNAMLSLGSWKWDSDSVKGYAYDELGNALRTDGTFTTPGAEDHANAVINMKGIHVGGQAQTTANLGVTFKPFKGFRIGAKAFSQISFRRNRKIRLHSHDTAFNKPRKRIIFTRKACCRMGQRNPHRPCDLRIGVNVRNFACILKVYPKFSLLEKIPC